MEATGRAGPVCVRKDTGDGLSPMSSWLTNFPVVREVMAGGWGREGGGGSRKDDTVREGRKRFIARLKENLVSTALSSAHCGL